MKSIITLAATLVLSIGMAFAQGSSQPGNRTDPSTANDQSNPPVSRTTDNGDHSNWGWIGLLGLGGLAGLRGRRDVSDTNRNRVRTDMGRAA